MIPVDFIDSMNRQLAGEADQFYYALRQHPVCSIRLNDKLSANDIPLFNAENIQGRVPWTDEGYYLKQRPQFTLDPLMHAGCYYVQDASSMFIEHIAYELIPADAIVLDLCAAPGGKATLLSQFLGHDGLLVANEVIRQRVFILSENIQKWGNGNTIVTHNKPRDFAHHLPDTFDCILVDAPCSGEGMFRKDESAQEQWSLRAVEACQARQKQIVTDIWDSLVPGGIMIYSTCTFNEKENEEVAHYIADELGADYVRIDIDPTWGIQETFGYHFYPHKVQGEGFYVCVLRKKEKHYSTPKLKADKHKAQKVENEPLLRSWLQHPDLWTIRQTERFTNAYPTAFKELVEYISTSLTCISLGFGLSEMRGRTPMPQHSLSMAKDMRKEAFTTVEVSLETALAYLRTEAITLEDEPIGTLLLTYQQQPLGFVKNIGNHSNNLYPREWRIRNI